MDGQTGLNTMNIFFHQEAHGALEMPFKIQTNLSMSGLVSPLGGDIGALRSSGLSPYGRAESWASIIACCIAEEL